MKKNILDSATAEEVVARARALKPTSQNRWGIMNVTEMLHHCNLCNQQILEGNIPDKKTTTKMKLLKVLSLYVVPQFPKNIKGEERNHTHGKVPMEQFEQEKQRFIELIHQYGTYKEPIHLTHPAFGPLTTRQWGVATWMHMDHHLRQFGV